MIRYVQRYPGRLIYIGTFVGIALFLSLTIGFFELPDSYFYLAIAGFLKSGIQPFIDPFNRIIPSTLYPPVYGLFILHQLTTSLFQFTINIPFLQLMMVLATSLLVYSLIRSYDRRWGIAGCIIFLLLPFVFVYAMTIMSEVMAMFFVAIYLYIAYGVEGKKKYTSLAMLVFVGGILVLTRNVFVFLFWGTFVYWIYSEVDHMVHHRRMYSSKIAAAVHRGLAGVGLILIISWMLFNYRYHHVLALTNYTGRHLYHGTVVVAHLLPPDDSPIMKEFLKRIPTKELLISPHGQAIVYFAPEFESGILTETQIDNLAFQFSIEAIKHNLVAYIIHLLRMFILLPMTPPYHQLLLNHVGLSDPQCPTCQVENCHIVWLPDFCRPVWDSMPTQRLFGYLILAQRSLYPFPMIIVFAIACWGAVVGMLRGGFLRFVGVFFIFFVMVQLIGTIDGRYMIPLYPAYAFVIVIGIKHITFCLSRFIIPKQLFPER